MTNTHFTTLLRYSGFMEMLEVDGLLCVPMGLSQGIKCVGDKQQCGYYAHGRIACIWRFENQYVINVFRANAGTIQIESAAVLHPDLTPSCGYREGDYLETEDEILGVLGELCHDVFQNRSHYQKRNVPECVPFFPQTMAQDEFSFSFSFDELTTPV